MRARSTDERSGHPPDLVVDMITVVIGLGVSALGNDPKVTGDQPLGDLIVPEAVIDPGLRGGVVAGTCLELRPFGLATDHAACD